MLNVLKPTGFGLENLSGQIYQTVLVPSVKAMSKGVLDKLKSFAASGGKVIFTGNKPIVIVEKTFRDAGSSYDFGKMILEGKNVFQHLPEPDFKLEQASDSIKYNHRKFANGDLYFIFNEGDKAIESSLTINGKGKLQQWNAVSGEIKEIEQAKKSGQFVKVHINIAPWETQIFVISN